MGFNRLVALNALTKSKAHVVPFYVTLIYRRLVCLFTEVEGREIEHLDYHEMYNPSNMTQSSAEDMEEQKQHSAHQDEFILKHLFKETGVKNFDWKD